MTISATTRGLRPGVCTSTTRPGSPFDGQLIYETDTNRVAVYDSSAWVYKTPASTTGSVLQVVSTTKTDTFTHTGGITFANVTGLSATITPTATSSKVLIQVFLNGGANNGGTFVKVTGGNTASWIGDTAGTRNRIAFTSPTNQGTGSQMLSFSGSYLDSPATTSATTYQVQIAAGDNVTTTYLNRTVTDTDTSAFPRSTCTITVMEIAG